MTILLLLIKILLGLLVIAGIITTVVLWFMALVQIFSRADLKNNKWMYLVLFLFTGALGTIIYYYVEGKKKLGTLNLLAALSLPIALSLFAIISFTVASLAQ